MLGRCDLRFQHFLSKIMQIKFGSYQNLFIFVESIRQTKTHYKMKNLTCANTKNVLEEVFVGYKTKIQSTDRVTVTNSRECYNHLFLAYDKDTFQYKESFFAMYLNRANKVLGVLKISEGGVCGTVCDARIIMQAALRLNASFIVLSHNHPSGNMKPSQSDIEITNRLQEAAKFMDMKILDHIIVSADENTYYSFGDEGRL